MHLHELHVFLGFLWIGGLQTVLPDGLLDSLLLHLQEGLQVLQLLLGILGQLVNQLLMVLGELLIDEQDRLLGVQLNHLLDVVSDLLLE